MSDALSWSRVPPLGAAQAPCVMPRPLDVHSGSTLIEIVILSLYHFMNGTYAALLFSDVPSRSCSAVCTRLAQWGQSRASRTLRALEEAYLSFSLRLIKEPWLRKEFQLRDLARSRSPHCPPSWKRSRWCSCPSSRFLLDACSTEHAHPCFVWKNHTLNAPPAALQRDWTLEDVSTFLETLRLKFGERCSEYKRLFFDNDIDGEVCHSPFELPGTVATESLKGVPPGRS